MKPEEKVANDFLSGLSIGKIIFEPDGNIPPDFSVNNSIGVEVRRLNQQYFGNRTEGLENLTHNIYPLLIDILKSFDYLYSGISYWVNIKYQRPLMKELRLIKKDIKNALLTFLQENQNSPTNIIVNGQITLTIEQSSKPEEGKLFRLGGGADRDRGGFLIPIYIDNIKQCISEKSLKIKINQSRYQVWWLILVDYIWNLDSDDLNEIKPMIDSKIDFIGQFKRICVINKTGKLELDFLIDY